MTDQQMNELKQFMAATLQRELATVTITLRGEIVASADRLRKAMRFQHQETIDGFAGVAEAFEQINNRMDARDDIVDQRLANLKSRSA